VPLGLRTLLPGVVARARHAQLLAGFPYARYADSLGLKGIRVDRPEQLARAWDEALSADKPVVFEAYVDPNVPPLPPHISLEQAKHFTQSISSPSRE
jgi:pyruvate dehydrogenase (quinone)